MTAISYTPFRMPQRRGLAEERDVALMQVAEVFETETEHRDPAHAKTPGKDRIVNPERSSDLLAENPCTTHLDPADTLNIYFCIKTWFGIRVIRWLESHTLKTHAMVELTKDSEQIAKRNSIVHDDSFELLELGKVRGVDRLAPVNPAYAEGLDRRIWVPGKVLD